MGTWVSVGGSGVLVGGGVSVGAFRGRDVAVGGAVLGEQAESKNKIDATIRLIFFIMTSLLLISRMVDKRRGDKKVDLFLSPAAFSQCSRSGQLPLHNFHFNPIISQTMISFVSKYTDN
jgi:hypothetical protein